VIEDNSHAPSIIIIITRNRKCTMSNGSTSISCNPDTPKVTKIQTTVLGWPTDTVSIDFHTYSREDPHTVLIFIPGNPGQCDWYVSDLVTLVTMLGHGFAARAVSHAGHSLQGGIVDVKDFVQRNDASDGAIPWTVDGQVLHKCSYMDVVLNELDNKGIPDNGKKCRLILMGHSFGCHVLQRMCILRPDLLQRTINILYLMPFIRMNADWFNQTKLNFGASNPDTLISTGMIASRLFRALPSSIVDRFVNMGGIHNSTIREIVIQLIRQPTYARNFFELGTEEIRDIPSEIDVSRFVMLNIMPIREKEGNMKTKQYVTTVCHIHSLIQRI
jgi:pimeloyl-ACP methyl ester carboxylesterase